VRVLEISIDSSQAIAAAWTLISIAVSLTVALSFGNPLHFGSWQLSLGLFFALVLVMVLPAYLLIALWHIMSEE
jgi:uncharacterized membrane protein